MTVLWYCMRKKSTNSYSFPYFGPRMMNESAVMNRWKCVFLFVLFGIKSSLSPYLIRFCFFLFALAFSFIVAWCFILYSFCQRKSHTQRKPTHSSWILEGMCNQNGNYLQLFVWNGKNVKRTMIFVLFVQGEQTHSNSMVLFCARRLPLLPVFRFLSSCNQHSTDFWE